MIKIKSLKTIVFPHKTFQPLKDLHQKMIKECDEKIAEPFKDFLRDLKIKL